MKRLVFLPLLALLPLVLSCDDSATEALAGPDLSLQASNGGETVAVTGSGHYVNSAGNWRSFSFHVRQNPDGSVRGNFQLVGHDQPPKRWHGPLTCFSVVGNEAWIGGFYEKSTNPNLLDTGFGFYVKDNGQGHDPDPDLVRRHVRGQDNPVDWCSSMPDVSESPYLFPIESGNIEIHNR
ncbi:MAG: hypothetical protein ACYSVY_16670 [Planctomycetota bacterium]